MIVSPRNGCINKTGKMAIINRYANIEGGKSHGVLLLDQELQATNGC